MMPLQVTQNIARFKNVLKSTRSTYNLFCFASSESDNNYEEFNFLQYDAVYAGTSVMICMMV